MKVLQLPFCYHPDPPGGTEVYVEALAHGLKERGADVVIAAPGQADTSYDRDGIRVRRFRISEDVADPSELYGEGDEAGSRQFERILDEEEPDLIHLHAFTRGVSLRLVRAAKARGLPVIFTYHTPTVTCLRGTLLRWGSEICPGEMKQALCAACALHGKGLNPVAARLLGSLPPSVGAWFGRRQLKGGVWTAARMSEFVQSRHLCTQSLFAQVDHVIAVCQWVKALLLLNGVSDSKITLSRQGLPYAVGHGPGPLDGPRMRDESPGAREAERRPWATDYGRPTPQLRNAATPQRDSVSGPWSGASGPLRLVFLGRLDRTKGPDVLIRAVRHGRELPVTLDLYGVAQGEGGKKYEQELRKLADGDARIVFRAPVPASDIVAALRKYDLLAVPSQWFESGPLVVLEAFGAGIPVLGSNLGGIAELVEDGVNGLLVEARDVAAWAATLTRCVQEPALLRQLRAGVRPPRTMATVAAEMVSLYERFLVTRSQPAQVVI